MNARQDGTASASHVNPASRLRLRAPWRHPALHASFASTLAIGSLRAEAAVAYVYTYLPTLPGMDARDLNDSGQIVGNYCPTRDNCSSYAYQDGTYTYFNPPNAVDSFSGAYKNINSGTIIGGYQPIGSPIGVGYLKSGSNFTDFSAGGLDTGVLGAANNGALSGFTSAEGFGRTVSVSFVDSFK